MNEGIETDKKAQIYKFNDDSAPQRNDLGGGSAEEALRAQRTDGDVMNEDNIEAPPMSEEPQTELSQEEIAAPIDDTYPPDRSLLLSFKFHRARSIYLRQEPGLSADCDVPIIQGSWPLPKLVEIFKNNLYQDEDFFNSMKTGGQGNSLSLVKLENFYAGKLEKYNDSIQNERPDGQKKKAMSALSVARTYMLLCRTHIGHKEDIGFEGGSPEDKRPEKAKEDNEKERYEMITEKLTEKATECKQLRDENKALVEHISALKEEVQKMKDQKKQETEKETYEMNKLTEKATECKQLRARIEQMKQDRKLNDVVHKKYVKSIEKLPAKLEEKRKECKLLQDINAKLAEQSERQHPEPVHLAVIPKGEAVPSCDLHKKINELTVKYKEVVKRLKEKESFIITSNYRWAAKCKAGTTIHDKKIQTLRCQLIIVEEMKKKLEVEHYEWETWCQAMKKEFYSGEFTEKDDSTFIELFNQYDRFYTIAQQGPKGDYQEDFTVTGGNQDKLMDVRRANVVLKKKINETMF
ncbi:hypothetical protein GIB67_032573 [Kingdonia uniflora]|uniref:Uncharacterized protein n=1 Tax=Kingdonia uniflora TaxID=39325 RepID=A0A7J7LSC7_9MAGN|nr:hypothetical protein GIB67_032573 [Kingdonia uniflora]